MSLKLSLKPGEKLIIDSAVITNSGPKCHLVVENTVPLLREKDILTEESARSPARRIYFAVQLMYIDRSQLRVHHQTYWLRVREFLEAAPRALPIIEKMSRQILAGEYYMALKTCKKLIALEEEILSRVQQ